MSRIINIIENLDKGAVENWLVRTFLESRKMRPDWNWTFYCILGQKGRLDEVVKEAGGHIIYAPCSISKKIEFLKHLRRTLKNGNYDIVHSHHDYLSGFYLLASAGLKFKKRILHIHNTDRALPVGNKLLHNLLLTPLRRLAIRYSDLIVGISKNTLSDFIANANVRGKITTVLYYGVDISPFVNDKANVNLRDELNIAEDGKMILFAGRLNKEKNPSFVMDILRELHESRQDVYVLFVGKGEEEVLLAQKSRQYNLENFVRLLGWRDDISEIMKASDAFVFPRIEYPKEGLGLVVVEAQAAGLPMILSRGIVEDAIEIGLLASFITLKNNPKEWALKIAEILDDKAVITKSEAYNIMRQSKFYLGKATANLLALYEQ